MLSMDGYGARSEAHLHDLKRRCGKSEANDKEVTRSNFFLYDMFVAFLGWTIYFYLTFLFFSNDYSGLNVRWTVTFNKDSEN